MDHGTDVHVRNKSEQTPLHLVAAHSHLGLARKLLELDAEVNSQDKGGQEEGCTPLHYASQQASQNGNLSIVQLFVERGAEVDSRNGHGSISLLVASEYGHANFLQLLLDHNAELYVCDSHGSTPLHCAASGCRLEVARILLKHNVEVNSRNAKGSTPLYGCT